MTGPGWDRLAAIFQAALERPPPERDAFVAEACAGDRALEREVRQMLDADRREGVLERDLAVLAAPLVTGDPPSRLTGLVVGPYRILELIGEGGMGVVYRATRPDLGQEVAVKVLRDAAVSPARRERFASEQRALARLNHPAIAQLYDADTLSDGTPWFAMEYVNGRPITAYCDERRTAIEARLLLVRAVAEAVEHAHRHLIIHRDLKPSNILVRDDGTVKLLDFGIAKQLETADTPVEPTRTGLRLMTPAYAAPEQLRGDPVGTHTDVYSLGVVLYELLAGRPPFAVTGRTPGEIERLVLETDPERPSAAARASGGATLDRASWADLDVLCQTAMHKDARRRYRTLDAFIRDIDHFLAGEPLEARPDTLGYRAGKFLRRHRSSVVASAVALAAIVSLATFYTVRLSGARTVALEEARRTQRIQRFVFDMFRGGEAEVGPADSLRVITLLERGIDEARSLDAEPRLQAALYHTLGGIARQLGQLDRADTLLRRALDGRRALPRDAQSEVAESELALGELRLEQARLVEADSLVRAGLARLERARAGDHGAVAAALTVLGRLRQERGEYDAAIEVLERALRAAERAGDGEAATTAALTELGNTHFYAGRFAAADSLFRRLLDLHRDRHGDRHPMVARDLVNIGAIQHETGRYDAAEATYRDALGIARAFYGDRHPRVAEALTMLSRPLIFQQKLDAAAEALAEAMAIQESVYGAAHPRVASTLNEIGNVALLQDRLDDAEAAYARVAEIYRRVYAGSHFAIGVAVSNLASVRLSRGEYRSAEPLFREAVAIFAETQSPAHVNTGIARIKLGRTLLRLGRFADAAAESRAGYDIMAAQTAPGIGWLRAARTDLLAALDALGRNDEAERLRAELADTAAVESPG